MPVFPETLSEDGIAMSDGALNMSAAFMKRNNTIIPAAAWSLERLPILVLPLSVVFLQGYALRFWTGLLGTPGGGVSLGLELLHLWFWNRAAATAGRKRLGWGFLAMAATGLLLAGALHEIAQPFIQESTRLEVATRERASLEEEAVVLKKNLEAYRDMAAGQGRRGWREDIRQDTARLTAITRRLSKLSGLSTGAGPPNNNLLFSPLNGLMLWVVIAVALLFQAGGLRSLLKPSWTVPSVFSSRLLVRVQSLIIPAVANPASAKTFSSIVAACTYGCRKSRAT